MAVDLQTKGGGTGSVALPLAATRLIGRHEDLARGCDLLLDEWTRLLTVTGPGGVGKTRFALELATRTVDEFADGVRLVELAAVRDPGLVVPTIGQALGLTEEGESGLLERLTLWLRGRELLLLLDNFEHLVAAGPPLTGLLASCPGLKLLVTSRARLHLSGERELPLPPLVPTDAVTLFGERARAVVPGVELDEHLPAVEEICARLDNLPLALELAAARVKLLSPPALLARLEPRLDLLTGGARDLATRQRTLRDTIAWSYDLLDEPEQRLFRRLGVFVGFAVEAAEAVCGASLESLARLINVSLLARAQNGRLSMLETIREYALERLAEQGEAEAIRSAHADWCLELAEEGERKLLSAEREEWFDRLERDYDNLSAALRFLLERGAGELALRLAAALARFWIQDGHRTEGRRALDEALALAPAEPSPVRAKALLGAGDLAFRASEPGAAATALGDALRMARRVGATRETAMILGILAHVSDLGGDRKTARAMAEEALAASREARDPWLAAHHALELGRFASLDGDADEAERRLSESLHAFRRLGDAGRVAQALMYSGFAALRRGDREAAIPLLEQGVTTVPQRGTPDLVFMLAGTAEIKLARGELAAARPVYQQLLELTRQLGNRRLLADWLTDLAYVLTVEGRGDRAARLLGAAQEAIASIGMAPGSKWNPRLDEALERGNAQLGEKGFTAALEAGRRLTLEQAVDEALRADVAPPGEEELTGREREILGLAAEGLSNAQIAERLVVSVRTVHAHLRSIYRKLGVHTRTAAARAAADRGLL